MTILEDFLENYNALVIDEATTAYYQVVHSSTDEVWHTFPAPGDAEKITSTIANMGLELATGNHSIRVQAIGTNKQILGQVAQSISGKSQVAKQSAIEHISHAKALSMNVETADRQLSAMNVRLEEANQRAREAEDRAGSMISDVYKMGDLVNKLIVEKESDVLDRESRESRNKAMIIIAQTLAPVISTALQHGAEFLELWIKNKKQEAANKKTTQENSVAKPVQDSTN